MSGDSWCSWLSREINILKVAKSNPAEFTCFAYPKTFVPQGPGTPHFLRQKTCTTGRQLEAMATQGSSQTNPKTILDLLHSPTSMQTKAMGSDLRPHKLALNPTSLRMDCAIDLHWFLAADGAPQAAWINNVTCRFNVHSADAEHEQWEGGSGRQCHY